MAQSGHRLDFSPTRSRFERVGNSSLTRANLQVERAMSKIALSAVVLIWATLSSHAQNHSPDELARRATERRAVDAVIWGVPAVNYDLMLQEMLTKTNAKVGQVVYWGRPMEWHNQTLTPNPDAIYFMAFFNTNGGPIVLDLPPGDANGSFNGNIVTFWQMPLEDAGLLGADKGAGGKYLVLPPGYKDKAPDGYVALQSDTFSGYMLLRANLKSHGDADVADAVAYGKKMKVYPLTQADNPAATVFTDANGNGQIESQERQKLENVGFSPQRCRQRLVTTGW